MSEICCCDGGKKRRRCDAAAAADATVGIKGSAAALPRPNTGGTAVLAAAVDVASSSITLISCCEGEDDLKICIKIISLN